MKICLLGKHNNRTPFSYSVYKAYFAERGVVIESNPLEADYIVFGFKIDISQNLTVLAKALKKNKNLKVVVLSEEPLWDTLWSKGFNLKETTFVDKEACIQIPYFNLNHFTSDLYSFNALPYFVTTENSYIARYASLFRRNSLLSPAEVKHVWSHALFKYAAVAEHRKGEQYEKNCEKNSFFSLSNFRTALSNQYFDKKDSLVEGKGWKNDIKRQSNVDWHVDKLCTLDRKTFVISALENTYCENYITEKIFDAFAVLGIPLYFTLNSEKMDDMLGVKYPYYLKSKNVEAATELVDNIKIDDAFVDMYIGIQKKLAATFSDLNLIDAERHHFTDKILIHLRSLG
jgi:hypothetical protein